MKTGLSHKNICPLVADPAPDCFCSTLTSQTIIQMVDYCCDRFLECKIFLRQRAGESQKDAPPSVQPSGEAKGVEA